MKRVYLDWGVISNLKKPEYDHLRQFLISHNGELFFVYSTAHFEDAMRSTGDERLLQDIQFLIYLARFLLKLVLMNFSGICFRIFRKHPR